MSLLLHRPSCVTLGKQPAWASYFSPLFVEDNNCTLPKKGYYADKTHKALEKISHDRGGK